MPITKAAFNVECRCGAVLLVFASRVDEAIPVAVEAGWSCTSSVRVLCPACLARPPRPARVTGARIAQRGIRQARAALYWKDYKEHANAEQIADHYGMSRERVRQLLNEWYGPGLMRLARHRVNARKRLRRYVEEEVRAPSPCVVCGRPRLDEPKTKPDARWAACQDHRWASSQVRTATDPDAHEQHRLLLYVRRSTDPTGTNGGQRWLCSGSRFERLCVEAYRNGWPLFDLLPEQIQQQVQRLAVS